MHTLLGIKLQCHKLKVNARYYRFLTERLLTLLTRGRVREKAWVEFFLWF